MACNVVFRYSQDPQVWGSLCNIWDMALGSLAKAHGTPPQLDFRRLMQQQVSHQLLKPVRARSAWLPRLGIHCIAIVSGNEVRHAQAGSIASGFAAAHCTTYRA